jgi:hypothetical protein
MAALSKRRDASLACGMHILLIPRLSVALANVVQPLPVMEVIPERQVARSASAIVIVPTEYIEKRNSLWLKKALGGTPGLEIVHNGGVAIATHA